MLSLTSTKSGALIGVLISVTTIPAAANIGVAAAYGNWGEWRGAMAQLAVNLTGIFLAAVSTLTIQRLFYRRRRVRHLHDGAREAAGLPSGTAATRIGRRTGRDRGRACERGSGRTRLPGHGSGRSL